MILLNSGESVILIWIKHCNSAIDLLKTMFSREGGFISVELVKKAIQEELRAAGYMTFSSFFIEKVIKAAANLF